MKVKISIIFTLALFFFCIFHLKEKIISLYRIITNTTDISRLSFLELSRVTNNFEQEIKQTLREVEETIRYVDTLRTFYRALPFCRPCEGIVTSYYGKSGNVKTDMKENEK